MTTGHRFGTAINCIDGRVQQPVADWVRKNYKVEYVDMVTEPGPDKALSLGEASLIKALKAKIGISVNAHHSTVVAIAGHHDCAANPVSPEEHQAKLRAAVREVVSWGLPVTVVGVWVDANWKVSPL